ncbi:MAG: bifunctional demethylmenaquinone methyltransferase/2-methoxy-6-polyprenyl-1,4-benzoquinol methylase UbiE [Acidobacteriota bacterium]|nr:bifunctional demethylmenaquinone methyltransferase/2-methoxy-6-polyprenyl-1,4-benzoquinol methylase UbiE [Acidobacteriota bacterium]
MKTGAGTTPPGTSSEEQAARWVQGMFAGIAPKYDFINHLLSFNIDRGWRRVLMQRLAPVLVRPDAKVLDLCCGTGDVLLDLQGVSKSRVMGADFCHPMLVATQEKAQRKGFDAPIFEADAMKLPLGENTLDAISISFGFRNLANYGAGLREFHRVLRPGGVMAILEFSHPPGVFMKAAYGFYSSVMLPVIGTVVSGSREAYQYLPDSIRKFPKAEELKEMMGAAEFLDARYELLTGGIAALHVGMRAPN